MPSLLSRLRALPPSGLDLLVWTLPLLGLSIVAGLWMLVLGQLEGERRQLEREAEARLIGLTQAYEDYARRSLQQVDQIMRFAALQVEQDPHGRDWTTQVRITLLRLGLVEQPGVLGVYLGDAAGQVLPEGEPPPFQGLAGREFFEVQRESSGLGLFVGRTMAASSGARRWWLPLSRRVQDADGTFVGVIVVLMDPRHFSEFYRVSQFGREGAVALLGSDGRLLARRAGERQWFGEDAGEDALLLQLARWPEGSYLARNRLDGVERRVAYKSLPGYALVVSGALSQAELLAPYELRRAALLRLAAGASALLLLAFGGLSWAALSLRRVLRAREQSRARFEAAWDASPDAFWMLRAERDAQGRLLDLRFTHCNRRGAELLGRPKQDLIGRLRSEVLPGGGDPRLFTLYCETLNSRRAQQAEFALDLPAARGLHLQQMVVPVGDGVALTLHDLSAERRREREMLQTQHAQQAAEKRLRDITDSLPVLISYVDRSERLLFINATFRHWTGMSTQQALGRSVREVLGEAAYAQRAPWLQRALAGERVGFELEPRAEGQQRWLRVDYVPDIGPDGLVQGLYGLSQDISALKQVQRELLTLARHDSLTGLANRAYFEEALALALGRAARHHRALALLFLDLDRFKNINDSLGHAMGDVVLKEFACRLRDCVRTVDMVARLAGDEFVVILEDLGSDQEPALVARKIAAVMARPFELEGQVLQISASIGIAYQPADQPTRPELLLARADRALYEAKGAGRNTFRQSGS